MAGMAEQIRLAALAGSSVTGSSVTGSSEVLSRTTDRDER
jgi:hypothetical protein